MCAWVNVWVCGEEVGVHWSVCAHVCQCRGCVGGQVGGRVAQEVLFWYGHSSFPVSGHIPQSVWSWKHKTNVCCALRSCPPHPPCISVVSAVRTTRAREHGCTSTWELGGQLGLGVRAMRPDRRASVGACLKLGPSVVNHRQVKNQGCWRNTERKRL